MEVVKSLKDLEERLTSIAMNPLRRVAIIGGHYPINFSGEAETSPEDSFGIFPEYTFDLAARIVSKAKNKGRYPKISLIVDDHSLMPSRFWYRNTQDLEVNQKIERIVNNYFANFLLPANYQEIMKNYGLEDSDIIRANPQTIPFQESLFRRMFEELTKTPSGCAGEYSLILRELAFQGIARVIGLIPIRCQGPTCQGAGNFKAQNTNIKIAQAYLPSDMDIGTIEELEERVAQGGIPYATFG